MRYCLREHDPRISVLMQNILYYAAFPKLAEKLTREYSNIVV